MKVVAAIMSMWIFFLTLLPCSDVDYHEHCTDHQTEHHAASLAPDQHSEGGPSAEHCPPFCHCNCCHSMVTFDQPVVFLPSEIVFGTQFPMLHDQVLNGERSVIWHPPIA